MTIYVQNSVYFVVVYSCLPSMDWSCWQREKGFTWFKCQL